MKTRTVRLLSICAFLLATLAGPVTAAQPKIKSPDQAPPPNSEAPAPRGRGAFARILTDEQRAEVRGVLQEHQAQQRDLDERIQRLQREVEQLVFDVRLNEDELRSKTRELAAAESERTLFRARIISKIRPSLSEDQIDRLKNVWSAPRLRRNGRMAEESAPGRRFSPAREGADLPPPRKSN